MDGPSTISAEEPAPVTPAARLYSGTPGIFFAPRVPRPFRFVVARTAELTVRATISVERL